MSAVFFSFMNHCEINIFIEKIQTVFDVKAVLNTLSD